MLIPTKAIVITIPMMVPLSMNSPTKLGYFFEKIEGNGPFRFISAKAGIVEFHIDVRADSLHRDGTRRREGDVPRVRHGVRARGSGLPIANRIMGPVDEGI